MANSTFELSGEIKIFPGKGGWHYVEVPQEYTDLTKDLADRGLVAITATVGATSWDTSLLPMGDGSTFIALPKKVRSAEQLELGSTIDAHFKLRQR